EPTSGLDPDGRRLVSEIIKTQRDRGATVFLNSHLLSEVEITCDRVAFIKHGEVLATRELQALLDGDTHVVVRATKCSAETMKGLEQWASALRVEHERLTFNVSDLEVLPQIVRHLVAGGADVFEVTPQKQSLEEHFLQIVGQ